MSCAVSPEETFLMERLPLFKKEGRVEGTALQNRCFPVVGAFLFCLKTLDFLTEESCYTCFTIASREMAKCVAFKGVIFSPAIIGLRCPLCLLARRQHRSTRGSACDVELDIFETKGF